MNDHDDSGWLMPAPGPGSGPLAGQAGGSAARRARAAGPRGTQRVTFAASAEAAGAALQWRRDQYAAQARLAGLRGADRGQLRALGLAYEDLDQAPRWRVRHRAGLRAEINAANDARGELPAEIAECEQAERTAGDLADKAEAIADLLARAERQHASPGPAPGGTARGWVRRVVPLAGSRGFRAPADGQGNGQARRPAARRGIGPGPSHQGALPPGTGMGAPPDLSQWRPRGPEPRP